MERKRKVIVDLETEGRQLARFDGLNVRFTVKKHANGVMNKADISVANLELERMRAIITSASPYFMERKRKIIRLFAGYVTGSEEPPLIYQGEITKAQPTMPPDIWLNMEARTGYYNNQNVVSLGLNGKVNAKEICKTLADNMGVPLNFTATQNKDVEGFSHNGGITAAINKINDLGGVIAFEDDQELKVIDAVAPKTSSYIRRLDQHSGMIGIPQVDHMGVKVKMLLDPAFKIGDRVEIFSEMMPKANGVYWCYALSHHGGLRETDFYTEIETRRMDILG